MVDFMFYTWGYHLSSLIEHLLLNERATDFEEILLHHFVTQCLFFCGIFANFLPQSVLTLFIHDFSDIFLQIGKIAASSYFETAAAVSALPLVVMWTWMRVCLLGQQAYLLAFEHEYRRADETQFQPYLFFSGVFLTIMLCLHVYWLSLMLRIVKRYFGSGTVEDISH